MVEEERWTNLFGFGVAVARAGATSLWHALGDVYVSPLKAPYFFWWIQMRLQPLPRDEEWYLQLFAMRGVGAAISRSTCEGKGYLLRTHDCLPPLVVAPGCSCWLAGSSCSRSKEWSSLGATMDAIEVAAQTERVVVGSEDRAELERLVRSRRAFRPAVR